MDWAVDVADHCLSCSRRCDSRSLFHGSGLIFGRDTRSRRPTRRRRRRRSRPAFARRFPTSRRLSRKRAKKAHQDRPRARQGNRGCEGRRCGAGSSHGESRTVHDAARQRRQRSGQDSRGVPARYADGEELLQAEPAGEGKDFERGPSVLARLRRCRSLRTTDNKVPKLCRRSP
jgi:hypothetical protein